MYDINKLVNLPFIHTIDYYYDVFLAGNFVLKMLVRVNGIDGIHTLDYNMYKSFRITKDKAYCNIGIFPWFEGNTTWVLCKDVEVIAIL